MEVLMKGLWRHGLMGAAATLIATLATAGTAHAGVLVTSAQDCTAAVLSSPFAPWGDRASYAQVSNGGLEHGTTGWTLSGGARVVGGNEPWKVAGARDGASLELPAGSSAISPPMCVGIEHPTVRFFARKNSGLLSTLVVTARVHLSLGSGSRPRRTCTSATCSRCCRGSTPTSRSASRRCSAATGRSTTCTSTR